jgi:hypothetical protein
MGMGNYAQYADTVKPEFVQKTAPKEYEAFMAFLDEIDLSFEDFANNYQYEEFDGVSKENSKRAVELYAELCAAFDYITKKDGHTLNLSLVYHDPDDTDRGNELYGAAWTVEPYILSPAGELYKDEIQRLFWTNFG